MEFESKHSLNVFGMEISIHNPKAYITKLSKIPILEIEEETKLFFQDKDVVFLIKENQFGVIYQKVINPMDYGVSADQFIYEFTSVNAKYCELK